MKETIYFILVQIPLKSTFLPFNYCIYSLMFVIYREKIFFYCFIIYTTIIVSTKELIYKNITDKCSSKAIKTYKLNK